MWDSEPTNLIIYQGWTPELPDGDRPLPGPAMRKCVPREMMSYDVLLEPLLITNASALKPHPPDFKVPDTLTVICEFGWTESPIRSTTYPTDLELPAESRQQQFSYAPPIEVSLAHGRP